MSTPSTSSGPDAHAQAHAAAPSQQQAGPPSPSMMPLPPGILARHSSHTSSTSRRSSTTHRSPSLSAQPDPFVPQRFSSGQQDKQDMLNAMEAEEEALVNSLSRKLEKLRAEKVELESTLEMEQEALVNRLQRRLSELLSQQQLQHSLGLSSSTSSNPSSPGPQEAPLSPVPGPNLAPLFANSDPLNPSAATLLEALQTENNSLRERLADVEQSANRAEKLSELYRLELLQLREKAGLDVADIASSPLGNGSIGNGHRSFRDPAGSRSGTYGTSGIASGAIRIPGASQSPPAHGRSGSKSSYSPSITSTLSMSTPYSASPATHVTTPSTSYTTPHVPASTPVSHFAPVPRNGNSQSGSSTPYGSMTSSTSSVDTNSGLPAAIYRVPPPSMASSLGASDGVPAPSLNSKDSAGSAETMSARRLAACPIQEAPESGQSSRSVSPASMRFNDNYSPQSLQRRLSASRQGARVAETGFLKKRTPSATRSPQGSKSSGDPSTSTTTPASQSS